MTIKIVTDSTCDLPPSVVAAYDITVIPVYINIGANSYRENVDISRQTFYENLYTYSTYPTTAAPAVGTFTEVYEQLTREGATEILSIHLAASLSNTYNAARLGAAAANSAPVTIFDTQQITLGSGLQVMLAAQAAAAGQTMAEIVAMLNERVSRIYVFGLIDTLESLRRSGRVNWASFGIGSLLQIKPVMMIHSSDISVVARVRTRKRSQQHMMELVENLGPFTHIGVLHVHAPEAAAELAQIAAPLFPTTEPPLITEVTPAIGTHLGVGAVGFACLTTGDKV
ncbi:MAG: DegV family protein [Anaerolineales bacterium]|nr:DegV family protein [Anaerolineales bacterium]